jgi:hypothetical protein
MNNDLISREALKKELHNFFDGKVINEPTYILRDVFCHIDNAPTEPLPDFKEGYKQAIIDGKTNYSRPQGEWIECTKSGMPLTEYGRMTGEKWYGFKCSQCNFIYKGNALIESPYCQKCGAKMTIG